MLILKKLRFINPILKLNYFYLLNLATLPNSPSESASSRLTTGLTGNLRLVLALAENLR